MPAGTYTLSVVEAPQFQQEIVLTNAQPEARADFDMTGIEIPHFNSVVRGMVSGGASLSVVLGRPADGWTQTQPVNTDGSYRFAGLGKGSYTLVLLGTDTGRTGISLDGRNEVVVDLAYPGWGWQLRDGGSSPGFGVVRCQVTGKPDVALRLWTPGWNGLVQRTGSKLEYGPDACEFSPLGSGSYFIQPVDGAIDNLPALRASLTLDGSRVLWITYTRPELPVRTDSVISGHVKGGAGLTLKLTGPAGSQQGPIGKDEAYRFSGLGPGIYRLEVGGAGATRDGIVLDGQNQATVDLELPPAVPAVRWIWRVEEAGAGAGSSIIRCRVKDRPGLAVHLWKTGWNGLTQKTGSKAEYGSDACEFAPLGAGTYLLSAEGLDVQAEVKLGTNRLDWVYFEPSAHTAPAQSAISGSVKDGDGRRLVLKAPDGQHETTVAAGAYRFEGLAGGTYRLALMQAPPSTAEAQVRDGIVLNGTDQVTVDFVLAVPPPPQPKTLDHYLLVGNLARTRDDFLAVLRYVKQFQPPLGSDPDEARSARHVTILGATNTISAAVEASLRSAGCQVQRIEGDYATGLGALLTAGKPY